MKTYSIVPIEYTYPEILAIQRLDIIKSSQFTYSGLNSDYPFERILEYFRLSTTNTEEDRVIYTQIILKLVRLVEEMKSTDSCILIIRLSLPSDEFVIPRFHHDGSYFIPKNGRITQEKFLLTIRGAGTLLSEPDVETRQRFFELFNTIKSMENDIKLRPELAEIIGDQIFQPYPNQGIIMKIFDYRPESNKFDFSNSAIHSEPNITQPRLFMSIVPGSSDEINEKVKERWNSK